MPALGTGAGLLATETLTNTYEPNLGLPYELKTNLSGVGSYVLGTTYTKYGETAVTTLATSTSQSVQIGDYYETGTRALNAITAEGDCGPNVDQATGDCGPDVDHTWCAIMNVPLGASSV